MGTLKQAVEAFGTYGGEPRPRATQVARFLQNDAMLPVNEGKRIKHVSAVHLTTLFLALATAPRPADSTRSALTWGRMTPGGKAINWDTPTPENMVLAEALNACIVMIWKEGGRGPMTDVVTQSLFEISITRPHAVVYLNGQRDVYLPVGSGPEMAEFPGFHRVTRIPGATIRRIATALYEGPHHNAVLALQPETSRDPYREPASVLSAPLAR